MSNDIEIVAVGPLQTNCYLVTHDGQTIIIDPGADSKKIIDRLTELKLTPVAIVNTHGHWDHVMANNELKQHYNISMYTPLGDKELLSLEKNHFRIGELLVDYWYTDKLEGLNWPVKVIPTPGHSQGSTCFLLGKDLFSGDTMFAGGYPGRTDFWGGDPAAMQRSLAELLKLPDDITVWPGHEESSTIGAERGFYG